MPKKIVFFILLFLVLAAAGAFIYSDKSNTDAPVAAGPSSSSNALLAEVYEVIPTPLQASVQTTGTLTASEFVSVRSEINGRVLSYHFTEGQDIRQGDLLFRLDDSELQAQKQRTLHRKELAESRVRRIGKLLEQGGTSQEDFDNAKTEVHILDAELQLLEAQLNKTVIRAPFDGRVGLRYVSPGTIVSPATELTTLQKLDPIRVEFSVPERVADSLRNQMKVRFHLTGSSHSFEGTIYALNPHIDASTRNLHVRADAPNPDKKLLPGSFTNIEVTLDEIPNALLIPAISLIPGLNEQRVFVVEDGKVTSRAVRTGQRLATQVQILEGLQAGDLVLTTSLLQAKPGMSVEIQNRPQATTSQP